jgi:hypothetical protein
MPPFFLETMSNRSKERRSLASAARAFGDTFVRTIREPLCLPEIPEGPLADEMRAAARARLQKLLTRRGKDGDGKPVIDPDVLLTRGPARWGEEVKPLLDRFEVPSGASLTVADAWLPLLERFARERQLSWSEEAQSLLPIHELALRHARELQLPCGPVAQVDAFERLWRRKEGETAPIPLSVTILQIFRRHANDIQKILPEDLLTYIFREEHDSEGGRVAFRFFPDSLRSYQSSLAVRVRDTAAKNGRWHDPFPLVLDEMRALSERIDAWQQEADATSRLGGRVVSVPPYRPQPRKE